MNSTGNSCYNCLDLKQITYGKTPNFENQVLEKMKVDMFWMRLILFYERHEI